jgi:outer membrane protein
MRIFRDTALAVWVAAAASFVALPAAIAGDYNGNFMARVGATVVHPDSEADVFIAGVGQFPGADAEVSTEVIPSLTLTYFFNRNLALELFCCFAKHDVKAKGTIAAIGDLGDTWIFPPALTLQYHFDSMPGGIKPYVGAGVQYINFFSGGNSSAVLGGAKIDIDDAFGFTLQAGVDVPLGDGWYLNGDVKKTWLDTDASWTGTPVTADVELDPWIFTLGVGYRFNLSDLLGG